MSDERIFGKYFFFLFHILIPIIVLVWNYKIDKVKIKQEQMIFVSFFFFFFFAILIFFKLVSQEQDDPIANLTNQNYLLKACYLVFPCLYYMLHT